jgi:hypothetical protein
MPAAPVGRVGIEAPLAAIAPAGGEKSIVGAPEVQALSATQHDNTQRLFADPNESTDPPPLFANDDQL